MRSAPSWSLADVVFAWFGIRSRPLPRAVLAASPPATARRYLVDTLDDVLYRSGQTQGARTVAT